MKRTRCGLLVALALVLAAWGSAAAQGKWTINPGVGVGPIQIGMPCAVAERNLTRDPKGDHQIASGQPKWIFYNEGLQIHYDSSIQVLQVVVDRPGIPTAEGVQVGDSANRFEQVYGRNYLAHQLPTATQMPKQYFYAYNSKGLGFQTEGDKILLISVFAPVK